MSSSSLSVAASATRSASRRRIRAVGPKPHSRDTNGARHRIRGSGHTACACTSRPRGASWKQPFQFAVSRADRVIVGSSMIDKERLQPFVAALREPHAVPAEAKGNTTRLEDRIHEIDALLVESRVLRVTNGAAPAYGLVDFRNL